MTAIAENTTFNPVVDTTMNSINLTLTSVDKAYVLVSNTIATFSIAGSFLIISLYVVFKDIRTKSRSLLVFLSIADVLVNLSTVFQTATYYKSFLLPNEKSFLCQTAAGVMVYSQVCASLWTVAISLYLCMSVNSRCLKTNNSSILFFHVFCWVMPLVVSLSADFAGVYGYNTTDILLYKHPASCWIGNKVKNPLSWYLLTVEGWVMAAYVSGSLMYFAISWNVCCKKTKGKAISGEDIIDGINTETANEQLRFIPVIFVCTRIWGTGYFFFNHYPDHRHPRAFDWLLMIKAIGDNSQGLVNAIFFCLITDQIRQCLFIHLRKCCKCFSGWCSRHRVIGKQKWMRVQSIVRVSAKMPRRSKNLDGSDLDLSGISLDLPVPDTEDDIIFER